SGGGEHGRRGTPGTQPEPVSGGGEHGRRGSSIPVGRLGEVLAAVWHSPKPVVARVGGAARAGGLGIIAAADIAVAAASATFAFAEVRIGVIPAVISATVLPRLTSRAAAELFLTGDVFDAARAAAAGLVTAAVPDEELDGAVTRYVESLVRGAPGALAGAKELLRRAPAASLDDDLVALTELSVSYFRSPEAAEGMAAFREKRTPFWGNPAAL
ncbi:MAG: methylglutaconyl-CoA hydratase, partial [Micromonosporaceae bacterium]